MSLPEINKEIQNFLHSKGITPELHSETDLGKIRDLFTQMTTILEDSKDSTMIAKMTEFIDKITPKINEADPRCLNN